MVRTLDKADAMLTLSSALYNIGSHLPFTILHTIPLYVTPSIRRAPSQRHSHTAKSVSCRIPDKWKQCSRRRYSMAPASTDYWSD